MSKIEIDIYDIVEELNSNVKSDTYGNYPSELLNDSKFDKIKFVSVDESEESGGRWTVYRTEVFKAIDTDNKDSLIGYIKASWDHPATEMQEGQDTFLSFENVKPVEKTITITEWV